MDLMFLGLRRFTRTIKYIIPAVTISNKMMLDVKEQLINVNVFLLKYRICYVVIVINRRRTRKISV
jgi:hypothetical protein